MNVCSTRTTRSKSFKWNIFTILGTIWSTRSTRWESLVFVDVQRSRSLTGFGCHASCSSSSSCCTSRYAKWTCSIRRLGSRLRRRNRNGRSLYTILVPERIGRVFGRIFRGIGTTLTHTTFPRAGSRSTICQTALSSCGSHPGLVLSSIARGSLLGRIKELRHWSKTQTWCFRIGFGPRHDKWRFFVVSRVLSSKSRPLLLLGIENQNASGYGYKSQEDSHGDPCLSST